MAVDKSRGSPYDLSPNSPHNMSLEESASWMKELQRRKNNGLPMDKPPGFYDKQKSSGKQ